MKTTALITGASGGIGLELARIHASRGGDAVLVARSGGKLEELKADLEGRYGATVHVIAKDLSLHDSADELYNELRDRNIAVDCLINNAGFGDYGPLAGADWAKLSQMIHLNVLALTRLTQLYVRDMTARGSGRILNVASTAAFQPGPLMAVYFATKAYVLSLSEAVGEEVRGTGVTVTALCPGPTKTGFEQIADVGTNKLFEEHKLSSSHDVALYGYNAMLRGKAVAVHGWRNKLLVTAVRLTPRSMVVRLLRKLQV